jgi:hypothetical protein
MSELVAAFISELIRAANEVDRLATPERVNLLRRAAATIRAYREEIDPQGARVSDEPDIVDDLQSMADTIDLHAAREVGAMLLEAVEAIKAGREDSQRAMDAEYESLIDEMNAAGKGKE